MRNKITVALTGLNNTDNPGPGVPVIRGIRESNDFESRILGLAYENLEPAIYMEGMVDKTYQVPYPSEGTDVLVKRILEIHQKDPIDVLIPNFDAELYAFMRSEKTLKDAGIHTFLPTMEQFEERHKTNLPEFGKKYDSPLLARTVHLIVEGLKAGGEIGDLLERISLNLSKSQSMQMEMAANVTSYVMFISFATVVAAPMLYGLSLQMIDVTTSVMSNVDLGAGSQSSMPMSIGGGTSIAREDFVKFAMMAISVTSFFSACIISMIKKGNIKSGIKNVPIFIAISIALFFFASWVLGKMFSGIF